MNERSGPGSPQGRWTAVALLTIGIGLFVISNGRWIVPAAAWLAPVLLLRFAHGGRGALRLPLLFAGIAIAARVMLFGIIPDFLGLLAYLLTLFYALQWFLPYLADRLVAGRMAGFVSTLVFPATVVGGEYLAGLPYGTWGAWAYTQVGNLPVVQVASLTGMWGISFLVTWFGAVVNWAWARRWEWARVRVGVATFAAVVVGVVLFGGVRLASAPALPSIRVAGFTAKAETESFAAALQGLGGSSFSEMARRDQAALRAAAWCFYEKVLARTETLAREGASIVLWPEGGLRVLPEDETALLDKVAAVSRRSGAYVLAAYTVAPAERAVGRGLNKDVLLDPHGAVVWDFRKAHLVPGAREIPGDGVVPVAETPLGRLATVICYDADFPGFVRQAGHAGVGLMLVPAWDWRAIDPLHAFMATLRGVENGCSLVRQTGMGLSIATDAYGRLLAVTDHFTSASPTMIVEVPTGHVGTLYGMTGDLFAWLCIAFVAVAVLGLFLAARGLTRSPSLAAERPDSA